MDANRFDRLARAFAMVRTRRAGLRLLAALPLAGLLPLLFTDDESAAKRRKKGNQRKTRRVGGENHKHAHRRRKHNMPRRHKDKNKKRKKKESCKPEPLAQTCAEQCGTVQNNCQQAVDCGSCACDPPCAICLTCNAESVQCEPDPAQVGAPCGDGLLCQDNGACACQGDSCGGCRACEDGQCVIDPSVVCAPLDPCHEAGVCDPETGACTNPRKQDGTTCDDGDPCTENDTCQNGECRGTSKDCSSEGDVCNDGVCRLSDGACVKRPKQDGTSCNADNTDCTSGDSCQNGVCTPGVGVDCRTQDDQCNRGVCRQSDGQCVKEPRQDGTFCNDGNACTLAGACQNGSCNVGAPLVCVASDACHLAGQCDPASGVCSDPQAPDGTPCGFNGQCMNGECVELCLTTNAVCDVENDTCCDSFCSDTAACSSGGEARCCRNEGSECTFDCDCCAGVCAGGVCCQPFRQCISSQDCCEGYNCIDNVCELACGTAYAFCPDIPCCEGFRCFEGECWPDTCLALTEACSGPGQCCQDGGTTCAETGDGTPGNTLCCKAHNQTCRVTEECCGFDICGPQGRCCQGGFLDPDRSQVRGCGASGGCCPGWKCNPQTDACCAKEGTPTPSYPNGVLDCCHFTAENGVCVCRADGQQCAAPFGHPFISNCCDGLLCVDNVCQPPCAPWTTGGGCSAQFPCCRGTHCNEFNVCVDD